MRSVVPGRSGVFGGNADDADLVLDVCSISKGGDEEAGSARSLPLGVGAGDLVREGGDGFRRGRKGVEGDSLEMSELVSQLLARQRVM